VNDASREPDDDARNEGAGTPSQEDPEPDAEPQAEADTGSEDATATDAEPDEQPRPASGQEDSSEPVRAPEPEAEIEATRSEKEKDETNADVEDEHDPPPGAPDPGPPRRTRGVRMLDAERAEPSPESAETVEAEAGDGDTAADDARSEHADEPREPEEPEPADEPRSGDERGEGREDGRTPTKEFRRPLKLRPPATPGDLTVPDLPRTAVPTERPRPTSSAPEPAPWPSTGGADGQAETESTASPHDTAADTALTRPAPDHESPEPRTETPRWSTPARTPTTYAYPTAHPTVEEALPVLRPSTYGDSADTTRRDGLPTPAPLAAAAAAYTTPPPLTIPPRTAQPPMTEAPAQAPAEEPRRKRWRSGWITAGAVLVLLAGLVTGQMVRPTPEPTLRLTLSATRHTFGGAAPVLPWPAQGQATLYVDGLGSMGSSSGQAPTPTASVAKVMTAYVFLREHPLQPGAQGPTFRISRQEAARLPARKRRGESLVEVVAGQAFTQRKALEALMLVSANNIAHELARWDAGNEHAFVQKMNAAARSLGMTSTAYTDPSGYDSRTVSTAADQVKLLTAAMKIPAFAEVVSNRTYVPNDGRPPRPAGNVLVGRYGVVGGKTGYTDAAGGNFVFAARKRTGNVTTTIVGAVMAQRSPSAMGAITAAQRLIIAAENALTSVTLAQAGAQVALVDDGLGGRTPLRAAAPVTVVGWGGLTVPVHVTGHPPRRASGGTRLGAVTAGAAVTPLALDRELEEPSILERLLRLA
jgi:D-alanyl-D-alanine carboxypeptidase